MCCNVEGHRNATLLIHIFPFIFIAISIKHGSEGGRVNGIQLTCYHACVCFHQDRHFPIE